MIKLRESLINDCLTIEDVPLHVGLIVAVTMIFIAMTRVEN